MTAIAAAVFLCLTLSAGVARADQNDERLDDLFARLAAAKDVEEARPIEADIWHIWIASDDSDTQKKEVS